MIQDVQYGSAAASVYDALISANVPAEPTLEKLRPHVTGARVLEIGVGTGRMAVPVAGIAREVVGLDNSLPMLDRFRAKSVPPNVTLVEADFREPLPLAPGFGAAYSMLGSLCCVRTRDELVAAFTHVRDVLDAGGVLCMEYYATEVYRMTARLGTVTVPSPGGSGTTTLTARIDEHDVLTVSTLIEEPDRAPVSFDEQVLLIDRSEVEECLAAAGFTVEHAVPAEEMQPYDWYTARVAA